MDKIRVLIVDDSSFMRRVLADELLSDPGIEIAGFAENGETGLAKVIQLKPDAVTLDLEMPVMDGLTTLVAMRKLNRRLPIIIFSSLSARGNAKTLEALALGASDYVTKVPASTLPQQPIRQVLLPKIKALCNRSAKPVPTRPLASKPTAPTEEVQVLVIGVSTGGPKALDEFLPRLSADFPVPIIIVQHMPQPFTRLLADRLAVVSGRPVKEAQSGDVLVAGQAWVAPGGSHLEVRSTATGARLITHDGPPENSCRPAVDVTFRSVAKHYGAGALAVVLTGMGQDGLVGCQHIQEHGGRILVQDEASSVVWGMPGAVFQAGLADKALSLPELATEINIRVSKTFATTKAL